MYILPALMILWDNLSRKERNESTPGWCASSAMPALRRCPSHNSETGSRCDMAEGHAGCHNVGGPYKSEQKERWVTPCDPGPCDYHETFVSNPGHEMCIYCGQIRRRVK